MDLSTLLTVVYAHLAEGRTDDDLKQFNRELEADPTRPRSHGTSEIMKLLGGRLPPGMGGDR